MRRTDRLFDIIQVFRDGRLHTAGDLARRMEVSVRTIYRDIDTLVASGVPITGERGVGYLMAGDVFLPPLNLMPGELEVLELGLALVRGGFGAALAGHADTLGDKVRAVLPRPEMMDPGRGALGVYHVRYSEAERTALVPVRRAILTRSVLTFAYTAQGGAQTRRRVRPLEVQVWDRVLTLTAWCEDRADFRTFRLDRMAEVVVTDEGFRPERDKSMAAYLRRMAESG